MATLAAEDRAALVDSVRRLLGDYSTEADVRRGMETESGYDPELWTRLAELGVAGLTIDEAYGGGGVGPVELEAVMEEGGAALLCSPLLSSILAATLIEALGDEDVKTRLLPGIANGSRVVTVALTGITGGWTETDVEVTAASSPSWRLNGQASYVTHAQSADLLLAVAHSADGLAVFEVEPTATGLTIEPLPTFDHTLRMAHLQFTDTPARRIASDRPVWEAVEVALDLARVALAGDQAGGARRVLDFTVDYAKTRVQFGRAIGGFQAIKHMAADLLLETESAISAARNAAQHLADGTVEAGAAISLAAFACADAYTTVTAASIQMHGGIAFTWDHPAHLYLRRARAGAQLFGSPSFYRERYLQQLGG